jgi:hypothetical protein
MINLTIFGLMVDGYDVTTMAAKDIQLDLPRKSLPKFLTKNLFIGWPHSDTELNEVLDKFGFDTNFYIDEDSLVEVYVRAIPRGYVSQNNGLAPVAWFEDVTETIGRYLIAKTTKIPTN